MAENNSINNTNTYLKVDPGASGDSYVQFDINTTGEFRIGVDDTDSDSFKISQGSALGTNDTFTMTPDGQRKMPLQPAFFAFQSTASSNVTGDGTTFTIPFQTEIFDQASNFSTPTFTSNETGNYYFNISFLLRSLTTSHTSGNCTLTTSNRTYTVNLGNVGKMFNGVNTSFYKGFLTDMDASDTVTVTVTISGSTKTVGVHGAASSGSVHTSFGSYLAC